MAETTRHPILVVDDEPEILYSVRELLRREFDVHTAPGGYQALQVLDWQPIHVVLTDQRMPGMTGVDLLARVRQEHPDVVRLVFTGYADIKAVIDAINQGNVFAYLTKPWDPDELRLVLRRACEQYERVGERQRLVEDLRGHLGRWQALAKRLREGGAADPAVQAEEAELTTAGDALLARLAQTWVPAPTGKGS